VEIGVRQLATLVTETVLSCPREWREKLGTLGTPDFRTDRGGMLTVRVRICGPPGQQYSRHGHWANANVVKHHCHCRTMQESNVKWISPGYIGTHWWRCGVVTVVRHGDGIDFEQRTRYMPGEHNGGWERRHLYTACHMTGGYYILLAAGRVVMKSIDRWISFLACSLNEPARPSLLL
jgi:hypothetical protein